jgi:hypothetical protein
MQHPVTRANDKTIMDVLAHRWWHRSSLILRITRLPFYAAPGVEEYSSNDLHLVDRWWHRSFRRSVCGCRRSGTTRRSSRTTSAATTASRAC